MTQPPWARGHRQPGAQPSASPSTSHGMGSPPLCLPASALGACAPELGGKEGASWLCCAPCLLRDGGPGRRGIFSPLGRDGIHIHPSRVRRVGSKSQPTLQVAHLTPLGGNRQEILPPLSGSSEGAGRGLPAWSPPPPPFHGPALQEPAGQGRGSHQDLVCLHWPSPLPQPHSSTRTTAAPSHQLSCLPRPSPGGSCPQSRRAGAGSWRGRPRERQQLMLQGTLASIPHAQLGPRHDGSPMAHSRAPQRDQWWRQEHPMSRGCYVSLWTATQTSPRGWIGTPPKIIPPQSDGRTDASALLAAGPSGVRAAPIHPTTIGQTLESCPPIPCPALPGRGRSLLWSHLLTGQSSLTALEALPGPELSTHPAPSPANRAPDCTGWSLPSIT